MNILKRAVRLWTELGTSEVFHEDGTFQKKRETGGTGADTHFGESGNDSLFARDIVWRNDLANGGEGTDGCAADKNGRGRVQRK